MLNQDIRKARVIKYGFNGVLPCYQFSLYFFFFILLLYSRIQNHFPFKLNFVISKILYMCSIISLLIFA
ncbi:hypothetical protein ERO13_D02G116401v2 [Gossypium hirsutum]|nr:hypothetical protein ERO13_D02G116401v2 [Gossypium hirsutum]